MDEAVDCERLEDTMVWPRGYVQDYAIVFKR